MALQWKCTECDKSFGVGDWMCADGVSHHQVKEKTYLCTDAPSDPSTKDSLKDGRTTVCNIPPPHKEMHGSDATLVGEGSVEFIRGRFATRDPEQQYWLDKRPEYNASEDQWKVAWYSPAQQLEIGRMELAAGQQRLENERNELLSRTKQKVTASV